MNWIRLITIPGALSTILRIVFLPKSRAHYREQRKMS